MARQRDSWGGRAAEVRRFCMAPGRIAPERRVGPQNAVGVGMAPKKLKKRTSARTVAKKPKAKVKAKKLVKTKKPAKKSPAKKALSAKAGSVRRTEQKPVSRRTAMAPRIRTERKETEDLPVLTASGEPNVVEVDEARERLGDPEEKAFQLSSAEGVEPLAEQLGEAFVSNVTGADDAAEEFRDEETIEEQGGPFVTTTAGTEFADGVDASNPPDAMREPFPLA